MNQRNSVLDRVEKWAEAIRALLPVGSRGRNEAVDELSDYDIAVFASTHLPCTTSNQWLSRIGEVRVCVPERPGKR